MIYNVNTKTNKPGFDDKDASVIRRYSDFTWLSSELARQFPGAIIPALPEKQTLGGLVPEFVEQRRRSLEKFMHRVAEHPELGSSSQLITFLQADDARFSSAKTTAAAAKPTMSDRTSGWVQSTVNSMQVQTGKGEPEKSTADVKIEEITLYITSLEKQLKNVSIRSEKLVKKSRETAQTLFEFAQSLSWLGQSEGDALGAALSQVGDKLDGLFTAALAHAESEATELEEPMEEYSRYTASVKAAIQQRTDKKGAYVDALKDLEVKQAAYNKLLSAPGKEKEVAVKQESVEKAQRLADTAKQEFESVSERLLMEFENFKSQKSNDIRSIVLSFVNLQIEYNKKSERTWQELIPVLEQVAIMAPSSSTSFSPSSDSSQAAAPAFGSSVGGGGRTAGGGGGARREEEHEESFVNAPSRGFNSNPPPPPADDD